MHAQDFYLSQGQKYKRITVSDEIKSRLDNDEGEPVNSMFFSAGQPSVAEIERKLDGKTYSKVVDALDPFVIIHDWTEYQLE